ncbi:hypothetical protein [Hydrogenophaga sp. PBL-H3]|uniref:hypothetical protein n=1 Tax=Hydrogenophaga sp. PBL-H3 TaxID=434010 RepID=UPI00131FEE4F|nr:hypothetical protein [Hydrogenophaga sp. PBL-H3]QHE75798.1 hypothetical protein F9Z45_06860 [Hydrogenophaga sp. PBL-H3]QHE80223.1 hypothetical protein F9Z44_06860 [Hydrogenophaga sp. PBL-H3]
MGLTALASSTRRDALATRAAARRRALEPLADGAAGRAALETDIEPPAGMPRYLELGPGERGLSPPREAAQDHGGEVGPAADSGTGSAHGASATVDAEVPEPGPDRREEVAHEASHEHEDAATHTSETLERETDAGTGLGETSVDGTELAPALNDLPSGDPTAMAALDDTALIDVELAEHERWAGSFGALGTAGSDERARFLLDQAGEGAAAGFWGGVGMGAVMGAAGGALGHIAGRRLATLAVSRGATAVPVPGLGPAIGGVMAIAGLFTRDWGASFDTIGRVGTGEGYEGLANDLEGIAEALDMACTFMDIVGGICGAIAVGMWVGAVVSGGALAPLALTLSAIGTGISIATTAVGVIINVAVRPAVTALRALHAFESQGDPAAVEAAGASLSSAAAQLTGAAGGALGGRAGGHIGTRGGAGLVRAGSAVAARRTGGRPAMSATAGPGPRVHLEVPEAPGAGVVARRPDAATAPATPTTAARPAATDRPAAASPTRPAIAPDDFSDLNGVVADLNASPALAARLTDTRPALARRATPWTTETARAYANDQAAGHRAATGMTGAEVQAGHTAAARNAVESGIREADWDTQPMMDLHSRRGMGLDATVTDVDPVTGATRARTRTRHTSQERIIDAAVARSRAATGGTLTPRGHLDAADYVAWVTANTPYRQGDIDALRGGGLAAPGRGPAVDPVTGRVVPPAPGTGPAASSPRRSAAPDTASPTGAPPRYAPHTETVRTPDRAAAMAQYHEQIRTDPSRESGVWRGPDGTYHVMQGDSGSVRPPSASGPLTLVYHSHPVEADAAGRGLVSQPSQAEGDFGVLAYEHGEGPAGRRVESELHFPTYGPDGTHAGFGATRFAYDPTSPLPLQVTTTLPGGRPSTQRYASYADFEARTGIRAGGDTPDASTAARVDADAALSADRTAAARRIDETAAGLAGRTTPVGARVGRDEARTAAAAESSSELGERGPAYAVSIAGLAPGESMELPINPAYPAPPGTPEQLDALLDQVDTASHTAEALSGTEASMAAHAETEREHEAGLAEAMVVGEDLTAGREEHAGEVDATSGTNDNMLTQAGEAWDSLGESSREASALGSLVVSLDAFRGMAHLFSYLPGDLGTRAETARNDSTRLIETLNRVSDADAAQAAVGTGRETIEGDGERIEAVASVGEGTDAEIAEGTSALTELEAANTASLAETEATHGLATRERRAAEDSQTEAQGAHDALLAELQGWAQQHRQAREDAVSQALGTYEAMGLSATAMPP